MFNLVNNKPFTLLYIAQILSDFGNWFDFITLNIIVTYKRG